jgi:hypothetical protein
MKRISAVAASVIALAGCGGGPDGPAPTPDPSKTEVGLGTNLRIVEVKGSALRCAVLIGPDDTYASRSVALDCDWGGVP